tara:strand:- start:459 stop:3212 length:2754 start_codon:yes stop_codon:yes gene_type:complete
MKGFKTFVINLERRPEKRKKMEKMLKGEEYKIFKAYDGIELNDEIINKMDAGILKEWTDPFFGRNITWGEVGCCLSHYGVMEKCVQENTEVAVILEDDVLIPDNFSQHINDCLDSLNEIDDWELCYLGRKAMDEKDVDYNEKFLIPGYSYWSCAYIINLKGMKKIIDVGINKNIMPIDEFKNIIAQTSPYKNYYKFYNLKEPLKMYSLKKLSCIPESDAFLKSDTENSNELYIPNDDLLLLATGTDMTDGLKRFINSCKTYGLKYEIMGLNSKWNGGNMTYGEGGGKKINLLLDTLNKLNGDQLVLVTDGYDVIMTSNSKEIIDKYKSFNKSVVFATESSCWPDKHISSRFPTICCKKNLYLNSGGFIGDVASIKKIVAPVPDNYDDQRWYTQMFLSDSGKDIMTLDYDCKIFQCLNDAETELEINYKKSRIYNKSTNTYPCQIHGNGGPFRKLKLNEYENYLMKNITDIYGYNTCKCDINIKNKKSIVIYVQFTNEDYNNNTSLMKTKLENLINQNIEELRSIIPNVHVIYSEYTNLNHGLEEAYEFDYVDYYWMVDTDFMVTNKKTLCELITRNKGIISPLLCKPGLLWSNYWGALNPVGFYHRSDDYIDIVQYRKKGCWNVPHISGNILINREYIKKVHGFFTNNINNNDFSTCMCFSHNCRSNNIFMYVTNMQIYGYIYDSESKAEENGEGTVDENVINKSLYTFYENPDLWGETYLHSEFLKCVNNLDELHVEEPCKWVFEFPFVNDKFCDELLNEVNERGDWSPGNNSKTKDERINNVESFPTQDIHMKQIGFREHWNDIVKKYMAPVVSHLFSPFKTTGLNIAFVAKYEMGMGHQQKLSPHHDSSTYSINITLNTPGVDFEGGGTRFIKENTSVQGKKGWAIIHPGKLTHYHEGLTITSGKRFIFVSFVN